MSKRAKLILTVVLTLIGLLIAAYLVVVFWHGSARPILAVADRFQPPSSWQLVSDDVYPPKIVCGDIDIQCPQVIRGWRSSSTPGANEFHELLEAAGWEFPIAGVDSTGTACLHECVAEGVSDGYEVTIYYMPPQNGQSDYRISMYVVRD